MNEVATSTLGCNKYTVENAIVEGNRKFEGALSIVTKDIEMLRSRQDMIYVKQDVLQSTLAGETPPLSRSFRSSSCPSTVQSRPASIWSPTAPIMSNQQPQIGTPGVESVLTPTETTLQQPQSFLGELSDISAEEVQSLLSGGIADSVEGVSEHDNVLGHPSGALSPYYLCLTGTPVSNYGAAASQSIHSAEIPATAPITATDQRQPINFSGKVSSSALIDPNIIIQQNRTLCEMSRVGRLALLLARWSYFGDDILAVSTLKGKGHYSALDQEKLRGIVSFIHAQEPFRRMSVEDFHRRVQPKILRAIGDHCKNKR